METAPRTAAASLGRFAVARRVSAAGPLVHTSGMTEAEADRDDREPAEHTAEPAPDEYEGPDPDEDERGDRDDEDQGV